MKLTRDTQTLNFRLVLSPAERAALIPALNQATIGAAPDQWELIPAEQYDVLATLREALANGGDFRQVGQP